MIKPKTLVTLVCTLVVVGFLAWVAQSFYIFRTTGVVQVTTSDSTASLAISGQNKQAAYIGRGSARVRLTPGTYMVSATDQGTTVATTVRVRKQQKSSAILPISERIHQTEAYNALYEELPLIGPASTYTIDYYLTYTNGQSSPVITIASTSMQAKEAAQDWLIYNGFLLSSLHIVYTTEAAPSNTGNYFNGSSTQP